jgi:hypothetical protein
MENKNTNTNMKKILLLVIAVIIAGGIGFYGGMSYGGNKAKTANNQAGAFTRNGAGIGQGMRGVTGGNQGAGTRTVQAGMMRNGGFINGEILSKDDKSVTIKDNAGGSKIVFLASSTQIMKFTPGSLDDLRVGENFMITGLANPDGSVVAQTIQSRPNIATSTIPVK